MLHVLSFCRRSYHDGKHDQSVVEGELLRLLREAINIVATACSRLRLEGQLRETADANPPRRIIIVFSTWFQLINGLAGFVGSNSSKPPYN